jgi:hypothetical protein
MMAMATISKETRILIIRTSKVSLTTTTMAVTQTKARATPINKVPMDIMMSRQYLEFRYAE